MRIVALGVVILLALACSKDNPTSIGNGGVEPVIGQWCSQSTSASVNGTTWTVSRYTNTTITQQVAGSDGIVRVQTVRGCATSTCVLTNAPANWTATDAITFCNQSSPLAARGG